MTDAIGSRLGTPLSPTATKVMLLGSGELGKEVVLELQRLGVEVVAVDRVPTRLALAEQFGGTPVNFESGDPVTVVHDRSEGRGAESAIEAVGSPQATRMAVDLLRAGGRLAAVGVHVEPHLAITPGEIYDRNLTYSGGRCPARHYMPSSLGLAARDEDLLKTLISHRLPLSDGVEAYKGFAERREGWTKVVLVP